MRELALEVPLSEILQADGLSAGFPEELLKSVELTYLLRIREEGFLLICRVAAGTELLKDNGLAENLPDRVQVKVLHTEKSGASVLQVSGTWPQLFAVAKGKGSKLARFMALVRGKPIYITQNPGLSDGMLRISLLGEEQTIAGLLEELKRLEVPYRVTRLSTTKAHKDSPLSDLTERQAGILRLAHSLGYYEVPKKVRVEDIARILSIDKGTAGEHLQRAEKHVFDRLFR